MACYEPICVGNFKKALGPGEKGFWRGETVPCGKCLGCRADQAREWSHRLQHESRMHDHSWFVTLSYNEEKLPENGSLNPEHLRTFFKTLRRREEERAGRAGEEATRYSYYACGEYGDKRKRPHYHAVLCGPSFLDKRFLRNDNGNDVWRSSILENAWPHGFSEFGDVTPASAAYVAGYVRKKLRRLEYEDMYTRVNPLTGEVVEVEEEFSRMSRRPAIGRRWIKKYWKDVYPRDYIVVEGKEYKPPRFYDKWMEQYHEKEEDCDCEAHWKVMQEVRAYRQDEDAYVSRYENKGRRIRHETREEIFRKEVVF